MSTQAARPGRWELADVVRAHAGHLAALPPGQRQVLQAIAHCRTATLGGHRRQCDSCGHQEISYNSCRDRHCPKCRGWTKRGGSRPRSESSSPCPPS